MTSMDHKSPQICAGPTHTSLSPSPSPRPDRPEFEKAFKGCDHNGKGYLSRDECAAMKELLVKDFKLSSAHVSHFFAGILQPADKEVRATVEDVAQVFDESAAFSRFRTTGSPSYCFKGISKFGLSTAEQMIPAARIIYVLQLIKNKYDLDKRMLSDVDWSIEQIAGGNIYESQQLVDDPVASGPSAGPQSAVKSQALPWLAQFSTPKVSLQEIRQYLNDTSACLLHQSPAQLEKKEQERVKRRSVLAKDIASEIEKINKFMETVDSENFSVMDAEATLGRDKVLPTIAFHIFQQHKIFTNTTIDENAFVAFISEIRKGYVRDNPYHNDVHAADVLQLCHFILTKGGVLRIAKLSPLDVAALLLSAIIHDFKHPGVTNGFLQNSGNDLALAYNDRSTLENYHVSEAYKIITKVKDCNLFQNLTSGERTIMRKRIINCVLATDMAMHNDTVSKFQNLITVHNIYNGKNGEKIINAKDEFESKQLVLDACLHLADIGNPCRAYPIHRVLALKVLEEFGRQGDIEKSMKLPISFLCDRTTINVPICQIGYITGVLKPLLVRMVSVFPGLKVMLTNANKCEAEWRKMSK